MAEDFGYTYSGDPSKQVTTAYKSSILPQYDYRGNRTNAWAIDPNAGNLSYTNPLTGEITTGISESYRNSLMDQGNKDYQTAISNNDPRIWQQNLTENTWKPTENASYNQLFGKNAWKPYSDFGDTTPDYSSLVTSFDLPAWLTQGQQGFNPYAQPFTSQFIQNQGQQAEYQPPPTFTHEDLMKGYQDFYNPPAQASTTTEPQQAPQPQNSRYNALSAEDQAAHSQLMQNYQNPPPATPTAPATNTPATPPASTGGQ